MQTYYKKLLNLTHFVCISLVTRASLPQILESYGRVQRDTICAGVPIGAFTHPANLHLSIGSLSLPTPRHVEDALELLRSAVARQADRPLTARVVGIGKSLVSRHPRDLTRSMYLFSRIEDPTNSLQRLCQGVRSLLQTEGLLKLNPLQNHSLPPFQTRVINTIRLIRGPAMGKNMERGGYLTPRFDATDINRKYKDYVLLEDVQLQELHISELGLKEVLYEDDVVAGYRNTATVRLPGTAGDGTKPLQTEMSASFPVRSPNSI